MQLINHISAHYVGYIILFVLANLLACLVWASLIGTRSPWYKCRWCNLYFHADGAETFQHPDEWHTKSGLCPNCRAKRQQAERKFSEAAKRNQQSTTGGDAQISNRAASVISFAA